MMLETATTNPTGAQSAAFALTALISGNKENHLAIRRTAAVEILIRILGTQSSKELVDSAARVLKVCWWGMELSSQLSEMFSNVSY